MAVWRAGLRAGLLAGLLLAVPFAAMAQGPTPPLARKNPELDPQCPPPYYALIVIGDTDATLPIIDVKSETFKNNIEAAAKEAAEDFQNAGYRPLVLREPSLDQVTRLLADPCVKAFWYGGHGAFNARTGYKPGLWLDPNGVLAPTHLTGNYDHISIVTLASCGQDQPEWRQLFRNAATKGEFDAWTSGKASISLRIWQFFHWYTKLPKGGPVTGVAPITGGTVTNPAGVTAPAPAAPPPPAPAPAATPPAASAPPPPPPPPPPASLTVPADVAPVTETSNCAFMDPLDQPLSGGSEAQAAFSAAARFAALDELYDDDPALAVAAAAVVAHAGLQQAEGLAGGRQAQVAFDEAALLMGRGDAEAALERFAYAAYLADVALGRAEPLSGEELEFAFPLLVLNPRVDVPRGTGGTVLVLRLDDAVPPEGLSLQLPGFDPLSPRDIDLPSTGGGDALGLAFDAPADSPALQELRRANEDFQAELRALDAPPLPITFHPAEPPAPGLLPAEAFLDLLNGQVTGYNELIDEGKIPGGIVGLLAPRMLLEVDLAYGGKMRADLALDGKRRVVDLSLRETLPPGQSTWTVPDPFPPQAFVRTSESTVRGILGAEDRGAAAMRALDTDAIRIEGRGLTQGLTYGVGLTLARALAKFQPDPWSIGSGEERPVVWDGTAYTLRRSPLGYRTLLPLDGADLGGGASVPLVGGFGQSLGFSTLGAQRLGAVPVQSTYGLSPHAGLYGRALAPASGPSFLLGGGL